MLTRQPAVYNGLPNTAVQWALAEKELSKVNESLANKSTVLYEHKESTRRPSVAVAALLGALMTAIGWQHSAPPPFIAVISISTLLSVWFFILGRHSGCHVDENSATVLVPIAMLCNLKV